MRVSAGPSLQLGLKTRTRRIEANTAKPCPAIARKLPWLDRLIDDEPDALAA